MTYKGRKLAIAVTGIAPERGDRARTRAFLEAHYDWSSKRIAEALAVSCDLVESERTKIKKAGRAPLPPAPSPAVPWRPAVGDRVVLAARDGRKCWWEGKTGLVTEFLQAIAVVDPKQKPQVELWRVRLDEPVHFVGGDGQPHVYAVPTPVVERADLRSIDTGPEVAS